VSAEPDPGCQRISRIIIEDHERIRLSATVENERKAALFDLIEANSFAVVGFDGPFVVRLGVEGRERLKLVVLDSDEHLLTTISLPIGSLRHIIKDYFLICDSYFSAIKTQTPSRIEAIDMARRGLHNEGAELLRERLAGRVMMDRDTARRLFTLICVLQIRGMAVR
jgi:uncharacterized protein (UPF0262 family)